jgi:multisubunit Na+/H+ antiporter MnhG subunit
MFEPISQSLYEIMMFSMLGFFLAMLYEPFRIIRLFKKHSTAAVAVQDFLFLASCGVIVFSYSLEFGAGIFRYFYIIGVVFGAAVYFLTVGKLINLIVRMFSEAIRVRIIRPTKRFLVKVAQNSKETSIKINEIAKKRSKDLKNTVEIRYNDIKSKNLERKQQRKAQEKKHEQQSPKSSTSHNSGRRVVKAHVKRWQG